VQATDISLLDLFEDAVDKCSTASGICRRKIILINYIFKVSLFLLELQKAALQDVSRYFP